MKTFAEIDPPIATPISGLIMFLTRLLTTPVKAAPMMMPIAQIDDISPGYEGAECAKPSGLGRQAETCLHLPPCGLRRWRRQPVATRTARLPTSAPAIVALG